jgi:glyoxylase I family protein
MKIEHVALQVPDPVGMADWYCANLGCVIARKGGPPINGRFLLDGSGQVMLELYSNPAVAIPDYASMDPLLVHVAWLSEDITADVERLVKAGARVADAPSKTPAGDTLAMLRDPWHVSLQLITRAQPMIK